MKKKPLAHEHELIIQAKQGESDAFKKLFEFYSQKVYNFVLRMLGNSHDAEDIVQEVFVKMYRKLPSLRDPDYFSTWLFSVAKNESINFLNRQRRKNMDSIHNESENLAHKLAAKDDMQNPSPQGQSEYSDLEMHLQAALSEIPEINRSAFILGVIQGYSYNEVGKILGCSVSNVKSRVFRARMLLSKKLRPYYKD
ncbi:MAG: RNA polymerase sigma factor [bacterium]